jgi:hypothetical protein|tara:strand:+ start:343 stop:558 length:216 start_codon:yes stop_codon:yes gene_type:complete
MRPAETKTRSIIKTIIWRLLAIANSFIILVWGLTDDALLNAIYMNMTGFFVYYAYERICNYVPYGIRENKE